MIGCSELASYCEEFGAKFRQTNRGIYGGNGKLELLDWPINIRCHHRFVVGFDDQCSEELREEPLDGNKKSIAFIPLIG